MLILGYMEMNPSYQGTNINLLGESLYKTWEKSIFYSLDSMQINLLMISCVPN